MDETPREIEAQIDRTRERLGSHLKELEDKVDAATDWREHFRANPQVFLGAAFVGGATLAIALHARSPRPYSDDREITPFAAQAGSAQAQILELWHNLKGALIGVAGARLRNYIGELVPDFDEHYRRVEQGTTGPDSLKSVRR
jgi:glutaredoxin